MAEIQIGVISSCKPARNSKVDKPYFDITKITGNHKVQYVSVIESNYQLNMTRRNKKLTELKHMKCLIHMLMFKQMLMSPDVCNYVTGISEK